MLSHKQCSITLGRVLHPKHSHKPRRLLKSTQVHPLLCKDPSQGHCAEEATLLGAHRSCCILLGQWRGTRVALEYARPSAGQDIYFYLFPYRLLSPNNYFPGTNS